jgi:hypothetical protein
MCRRLGSKVSRRSASGSCLLSLEVLHRALVLFGCGARFEGAQISPPFGFRVELARVQPIFAGAEFAYHSVKSSKYHARHGCRQIQRAGHPQEKNCAVSTHSRRRACGFYSLTL